MTARKANDGGELRRRFLDAALEILREPDTSLDLRKVAERAGKSRTAPYLAFGKTEEGGGLDALQLAVAGEGFRRLADRMGQALRSSRDSEEGLRGLSTAYLAFARDESRLFRLMFGPEVGSALNRSVPSGPGLRERTALREARAETEFVLLQAIGMETQGYLRRHGSLDPTDLAGAVWAMLHGVAMLTIDEQWDTTRLGRLDDPEELASRTLRFLTTASSETMRPAREALMEAMREKGLGEREREALELESDRPVAGRPDAGQPDADPIVFRREGAPTLDVRSADGPREVAREPLAYLHSEPGGFESPGTGASRGTDESRGTFDSSAIRRARGLAHLAEGARVLWIDDVPDRSAREAAVFEALGMEIDRARRTGEALARLERERFDLIISDIDRGGPPGEHADRGDEGVRALPLLLEAAPGIPVIFYVGTLRRELGTPPGAFGITGDPEELVHLVFDALERGEE